jgi:hypothetical protein
MPLARWQLLGLARPLREVLMTRPSLSQHSRFWKWKLQTVSPSRVLAVAFVVGLTSACTTSPTTTPQPSAEETTAAREGSVAISAADVSEDWPLTVQSGTLSCDGPGSVTFTAPDGTTYAVNGMAKSFSGAPDIDPIWADDPDVPGLKISIGELIERGLALCGE